MCTDARAFCITNARAFCITKEGRTDRRRKDEQVRRPGRGQALHVLLCHAPAADVVEEELEMHPVRRRQQRPHFEKVPGRARRRHRALQLPVPLFVLFARAHPAVALPQAQWQRCSDAGRARLQQGRVPQGERARTIAA